MRKKFLSRLIVKESEETLIWATTAQPLQPKGWTQTERLPDGCLYSHPKLGLASFRGFEDDAQRRWMHFSLLPTSIVTLEIIRDVRRAFFPDSAIVALAIVPGSADMVHLWWALDLAGLPMDPGWRAMVSEDEEA